MIYTTGYYGHQPEALKALADALGATVVDIRFMPASRVPGWRKQALQKLLGDRYLWVQAFGNIHYNDGQPIQIADMAAGGGTPLAAAIEAGLALALRLGRADEAPNLVILTDGQGNVALDGAGGRARAETDALAAAARLRGHAVPTLMLDTSDRPNPRAGRLAEAMGATYLPLPRADAGVVAAAVRSRVPARRAG